uniref:HAD-like domain-containing protein n=1 Tax=Medicago truncatula TaxID=3880 RepID=B7FI78_MEDTR|nr:unknown [Medicago truncatula]AFK49628.1 unknown [Medicago truncatula]
MGHLYALDFDGVLCDTCGETAISALKAAKLRWPDLFGSVDSSTEDWIVEQMIKVRPVVETGYETLLLVRLLLETRVPSIRKSSVAEGLTVEGVLEDWFKLKPIVMEEWNENRDDLIDLFGKVRDDWLENDFAGWIQGNRFYPGVADALRFASSKVYIVTTKLVWLLSLLIA